MVFKISQSLVSEDPVDRETALAPIRHQATTRTHDAPKICINASPGPNKLLS